MIRFIHIPKCAGTTVGKMLGRNHIPFRVGLPDQQHTRHWFARNFNDGLDTFTVVRNPLTRLVSHYEWMRRLPRYRDISFDRFVGERFDSGRAKRGWIPQREWTHDQEEVTRLVTHVLHYENLQDELLVLFPQITGKFLHLNSGSIADHLAYYNAHTRSMVEEHFRVDFEEFGY